MTLQSPRPARNAFTLIELLIAMAMIVMMMSVLSEAFIVGLETFRELKGIGDLNERLRGDAIQLREDTRSSHFETSRFIGNTLRTDQPDPKSIAELRNRFRAISADAIELDERLREVGYGTRNPIAKWLLMRVLEMLEGVRAGADTMVALLERIDRFVPD